MTESEKELLSFIEIKRKGGNNMDKSTNTNEYFSASIPAAEQNTHLAYAPKNEYHDVYFDENICDNFYYDHSSKSYIYSNRDMCNTEKDTCTYEAF